MKIRLGYACISNALNETSSKKITYKYYSKIGEELGNKKINEIIISNIKSLKEILKYNIKNEIYFYRMTANLIPLINHPDIKYNINYIDKELFKKIGKIIKYNNLRIDIHADQYTVLNSTNKDTLISSINILNFYKDMFKMMNIDSKIVIHVRSKINGKLDSMKRFIDGFNKLEEETKKMIIIENDDKVYNIRNVLKLCKKLNVPMVLDYHHYKCNNNNEKIEEYIKKIFDTWKMEIPKIHFSSPKNKKEYRSHSEYIDSNEFIKFIEKIKFIDKDFDIMIEAKGKDNALFRLVRELKYKTDYKFINNTTFLVK